MKKHLKYLSNFKDLNLLSTEKKPTSLNMHSIKLAFKANKSSQAAISAKQLDQIPVSLSALTSEKNLFLNATQDVDRMHQKNNRHVATKSIVIGHSASSQRGETMTRLLHKKIDFELTFEEEYMHGFIRGLDMKTFQLLKSGRLSSGSSLDMHGLKIEQVYDSLSFFLHESYLQGRRCVLLVTGRGNHSPGGQSLLKQESQIWLTHEPISKIVLAFCTAQPKDGGMGAIYVLLRKYKKVQNKV